ncbi:MAG: choice-of-anchor Q domain-containing protein, partial [Planctomycetaceae bacterium]
MSAGLVTVTFTEDVTGVDIDDFSLTRDGVAIDLDGLTVEALSAWQYTVDLSTLTAEDGQYELSLISTDSGIRDTENNRLVLKDSGGSVVPSKSDVWDVDTLTPSLADLPDSYPGDGLAATIGGAVTLRAAVMESNASVGDDVITLAAGTYMLTLDGRFEDGATTGDLDVTGNLIIRGAGPALTVIDGNAIDRLFHVHPGASLTLENLTLQNGFAFDGAGILNEGTLSLLNVNIRNNQAGNQGGGLYNTGTVTGSSVSIVSNTAGSRGGAINNLGDVQLISSTLSDNYAVSRGGAIYSEAAGTATLWNATITDNESGSRGGALNSETIESIALGSSLLERNATDAVVPGTTDSASLNFEGRILSLGYNLIQVLDEQYTIGASAGLLTTDTFGRDSSALADSSGPLTFASGNGLGVHELTPGSLAIDAGDNAAYPNLPLVDQLDNIGNPRLIDGDRDGEFTLDIGATEFLTNDPVAIFTANPNPAALNELITFDASLSTHPNPSSGRFIDKLEWYFDYTPGATADLVTTGGVRTATHAYTDAAQTTYTVRLVVTDNLGATSFSEQVVSVGVPTTPVVQRPFTITTDTTPEIRWTGSPAQYRVTLLQAGQPDLILADGITTTSFTPTVELAPGDYRVVITATNAMGSASSVEHPFRITTLTTNRPVGSTFDITPIFNWVDIPDTSRYQLWVDKTAPQYIREVINDSFVDSNSYEAVESLGLGTFQWWVRAFDLDGNAGEWSEMTEFDIDRPVMTAPFSITMDTTPTFEWTDMGAARYELWVNQVGARQKIIYENSLPSNSYTPPAPLPNGLYHAWVRPLAADGEPGLWSQRLVFQMDYRLGPTTYTPEGITTDRTPDFVWDAVDGAIEYELWVNNVTTGERKQIYEFVPHVPGAEQITWTSPTELNTSDYRWWVRAIGSDGFKTAWSAPPDFHVPVPIIVNPRGAISTNVPRFTWQGVTEYVSYDLWVDNLTTGEKQV